MSDWMCWWRHQLMSCTPKELLEIIDKPSNGEIVLPIDSYNRVFDGILIGDQSIARNIPKLKKLDIKHVLNAAFGSDTSLNLVDISPEIYSKQNISFLGIKAIDLSSFDLTQYFDESANFIETSLEEQGNILVHCREGMSRSATLVISYLMIKKGMSVSEAVKTVRKEREIRPNDGFLTQLCFLNDKLIYQKENQNKNINN